MIIVIAKRLKMAERTTIKIRCFMFVKVGTKQFKYSWEIKKNPKKFESLT